MVVDPIVGATVCETTNIVGLTEVAALGVWDGYTEGNRTLGIVVGTKVNRTCVEGETEWTVGFLLG